MPTMPTRFVVCLAIFLGFLTSFHVYNLIHGEEPKRPDSTAVPDDVLADWLAQDGIESGNKSYREAIVSIAGELGAKGEELRTKLGQLENVPQEDSRWKDLYRDACAGRRGARLQAMLKKWPRIVFTKHYDLGGSFYAYTEGQSDAQNERTFVPGASLCLLEFDGLFGKVRTLVDDSGGVVRDPDVSYDGKKILFAWKKSLDEDDYHLYDFDVATERIRQLTSGLGFADYEGVYIPNGDVIFSSTRCVQTVDCWWTEVSNLYTCDADGRYLRRLGFDQVHTNYPTVLSDGRIIYTRWEYNDRGQMYPQSLFQMNPDGTAQTEYYGNNSWFPTSLLHARAIPGTGKVAAIFSGHHCLQKGWLGVIDPSRGRQENQGAQLIAPVRETEPVREDGYGQSGDQFQYPYPMSETEFLVAFKPDGSAAPFAIYWMAEDGRRELLAADPKIPCNQPVPLVRREKPHIMPIAVDYRKKTGFCYMQDIYLGKGLEGIPRGTVKKLRIVALDYRAAGIGSNENEGPDGAAMACTPVATGNGSWDPKIVLGEVKVHDDGSAFFELPARTPVYFQALDENGHAIQTMRSWATLQPGEVASCVGCHEDKNTAPPIGPGMPLMALREKAEKPGGFYGPPRGFSFRKEIQPILDRHCTVCHDEPSSKMPPPAMLARSFSDKAAGKAFSLRDTDAFDESSKRRWSQSYLALTSSDREMGFERSNTFRGDPKNPIVNWISAQSQPGMIPPYSAGAAKSRLVELVERGHGGAKLSQEEIDKIACWIDLAVPFCGDYLEANNWSEEDREKYSRFLKKRKQMEEIERQNIQQWIRQRTE
jgi:hypothetical protein